MHISSEEAEQALKQVEASRRAMRAAIRSNSGHLHLWMWGLIWILMAAVYQARGKAGVPIVNWLCGGGVIASVVIGMRQGRRVRSPIDKRFIGAVVTLLLFSYIVWPSLLGVPDDLKVLLAYSAIIFMQIYILGGLWFDNCLLWTGILITVFLLASLWLFHPLFYILFAIFGGGTLIATGFYMRFLWR